MEQWKKVSWSDESCFLLLHVEEGVHLLPEEHLAHLDIILVPDT